MGEFVLKLKEIVKTFPGVTALNGVNFDLRDGEVHALLGENGAGKSTLIKIITGVYQPDSGEIILMNKTVKFVNPVIAQRHGISAIYQEPIIFPDLSVTENIFINRHEVGAPLGQIKWGQMHEKSKKIFDLLGVDINPRSEVRGLSGGKQQMIGIARALLMDAKILIMDEPTAALSLHETDELFEIVRRLCKEGTSVIFVSHRLEEISKIADRVTVLRDGNYVGTRKVSDVSSDELIQMMVGRKIKNLFPKVDVKIGREVLRVDRLTKIGKFSDISFSLHSGEILGFSGLIGAGRTDVAKAIFGVEPADSGKIWVNDEEVIIDSPRRAMELGIAYLPEDRQQYGLLLPMTIARNITLPILDKFARMGWIDSSSELETAKNFFDLMKIHAESVWQKVNQLSGGNQQRVVLAKWLAIEPKILILDEPTKGIDVGAKASVHKFMGEMTSKGIAIIMISSELPEILGMSDNIVVMHEGRVMKYYERLAATQEKILSAAINSR